MTRGFADMLRELGELRDQLADAPTQNLEAAGLLHKGFALSDPELYPDDDQEHAGERAELGAEVVDVFGKLAQLARVREILSRSHNHPRAAHEMAHRPNSSARETVEFVPLRRRPPGTALPSSAWVPLAPGVLTRKARRAV